MDVTVMDFGLFAQEGYEDKRSIALQVWSVKFSLWPKPINTATARLW